MHAGPEAVAHAGQSYYRPRQPGQPSRCAYVPDERPGAGRRRPAPNDDRGSKVPRSRHAWDEAWSQAAKGQLNAVGRHALAATAVEPGQARDAAGPGGLMYETIAPLLEKTRSYAIGIDAGPELKTDLVAIASRPTTSSLVTETVQALLTLGTNALLRSSARSRTRCGNSGEANAGLRHAVGHAARERPRSRPAGSDDPPALELRLRACRRQ